MIPIQYKNKLLLLFCLFSIASYFIFWNASDFGIGENMVNVHSYIFTILGFTARNNYTSSNEIHQGCGFETSASNAHSKINTSFYHRNTYWPMITEPKCRGYVTTLKHKFVAHLNIANVKIEKITVPCDITLLTQLSINRIESLKRLLLTWEGPVSVAIYTKNVKKLSMDMNVWLRTVNRTNIQIHLVEEYGSLYPVNHLRNIAQDNAYTQFVFMIDVDYAVVPNLYEQLKEHLSSLFVSNSSTANALVIPAFVVNKTADFPRSKEAIRIGWKTKIDVFKFDYALKGNAYQKWISTEEDFIIPYRMNWEFYYVIDKRYSMRYDEIFLQRWYDKISHALNLHSIGFQFWVYAEGYIVHLPHERVTFSLWFIGVCSNLLSPTFYTRDEPFTKPVWFNAGSLVSRSAKPKLLCFTTYSYDF